MKLMIDISDSTYEAIMARDWRNAGWLFSEEMKAIHNGIPIPENPTNGDMIKALFPNVEITEVETGFGKIIKVIKHLEGKALLNCTFKLDWWNAPYKRGDTE